MANMSYCRFENTNRDMDDCCSALQEATEAGRTMEEFLKKLSSNEERAAVKYLYDKAQEFVESFEELETNSELTKSQ